MTTNKKYVSSVIVVFIISFVGLMYVLIRNTETTSHENNTPESKNIGTKNNNRNIQVDVSEKTAETTPSITEPDIATYESAQGGYTISLPKKWKIYKNEAYGFESLNIITSDRTSSENRLMLKLSLTRNKDSLARPSAVDNGDNTKLPNGYYVWTSRKDKSTIDSANDKEASCPFMMLNSRTNNELHFSIKTRSDLFLTAQATYCGTERSTPTLDYEEQLQTSDWKAAIAVLESIKVAP